MRALLRPLTAAAALAALASALLPAPEAEARRRCVPTLYNCNCTFVSPCPVRDSSKIAQTSLAVVQERTLLETLGIVQPEIDLVFTTVPAESVGPMPRIPAQQLLTAIMRGTNPANMLGAPAPLAGLAFGASPIAGPGLELAGQGMPVGRMMADGQVVRALPGLAQLAVPAPGLTGAADALGGAPVVQQGFQVVQGLAALSQQAMALRAAAMQQVFQSLPGVGAPSYASPGIGTHAAAWLPAGAPMPSGGDFASVRQAVVRAYESGDNQMEISRRADAAVMSVAADAQAKALQIRHALRRHAEITPRLEAAIQAARTVGDDWRANAAVQMALSAIDDEMREAETVLLALRASQAAAQGIGHRGLQAATAGGVGDGETAADMVAEGRTDRDAYVDTIVRLESRPGDPGFAHPNSTAMGDGQFLRGTWSDYVRDNPDRFAGLSPEEALARRADPMESRRAIAWYADRNGQTLARAGLPVNNTTLGLAHRFGAGGATAILRSHPSTPIEQALPNGRAVLAANPDLRGRTVGDVVRRTAQAFGGA
jgi:hypothetical protein